MSQALKSVSVITGRLKSTHSSASVEVVSGKEHLPSWLRIMFPAFVQP